MTLVVPRQNGKGSILEALELFNLFLNPECRLITHTAHRFDTCLDHFLRIRTLIEETPDLMSRVKRILDSNGKEGIELRDGSRLNFKARSKGSGRGFSGDLVVFDEAYYLQDLASLVPTMSARPNPQAWYTSSAPIPRVESDSLRKLCKRGREGKSTMTYFEWSIESIDVDLDDHEVWASVNPSIGNRLSIEAIEEERLTLDDDDFRTERLGWWSEDEGEPSLIPDEWWAARAAVDDVKMPRPLVAAIETDADRAWTSLGVAGRRPDGIGVGIIAHQPGVPWVVAKCVELYQSGEIRAVAIDKKSNAATLIDDLGEANVPVIELGTEDIVRACGDMFDMIRPPEESEDGEPESAGVRVWHRNQDELNAAVGVATKRQIGEAWAWDRRHPGVAVSPLCAVTWAAHALGTETEMAEPGVVFL